MDEKTELKEKEVQKTEKKEKIELIEIKCPHCGEMCKTPKKAYNSKWSSVHCKNCKRYIYRKKSHRTQPHS